MSPSLRRIVHTTVKTEMRKHAYFRGKKITKEHAKSKKYIFLNCSSIQLDGMEEESGKGCEK